MPLSNMMLSIFTNQCESLPMGKWYSYVALFVGTGGWLVTIFKIYVDTRKEQRANAAEARAELAATRARDAERRAKAAEERAAAQYKLSQIQPLAVILERLEDPALIRLYGRIEHLSRNPHKAIGASEAMDLRAYAAELEGVGLLLISGQTTAEAVNMVFGDRILTTNEAKQLWVSENMGYWRTFEKLTSAVIAERKKAPKNP